jgi:hypothetical protein
MSNNNQTNQSSTNIVNNNNVPSASSSFGARSGMRPQEVIASNNVESSGLRRYQFISDNPKFYMCIGVQKYARINSMQVAKGNPLAQLILPIPQALNDMHSVDYSLAELGFTGALATNALSPVINSRLMQNRDTSGGDADGRGSLWDNPGALLAGAITAAGGAVGDIGRVIGGDLMNAINTEGLGNALSASTGLTKNNFQVHLLKGPSYKKLDFTWKLAPKNLRESIGLKNMVADVNNWMAPGIALNGVFFTFPAVFNIEFSHPQFLYQFKPSVCTSCVVNYTASGMPSFHKDGEPESIILKMSFWELEYWLSGDFARADYYTDKVTTPSMTGFNFALGQEEAAPGP